MTDSDLTSLDALSEQQDDHTEIDLANVLAYLEKRERNNTLVNAAAVALDLTDVTDETIRTDSPQYVHILELLDEATPHLVQETGAGLALTFAGKEQLGQARS